MNLNSLQQLFQKSADVKFQQYTFNGHTIHLITCEAMIDLQLLNEVIVPRVGFLCSNLKDESLEAHVESNLYVPDLTKVKDEQQAILQVYTGFVLLYFEEGEILFSSNIAKKPNRNPEETKAEVTIRGPRDNFIEDIAVNIAIIRKRLPTNSLCVEKFEVGERSKTNVAILYFDDVANKEKLNALKKQFKQVTTDAIFSADKLMELVEKSAPLFPRHDYTGRPDFVVQSLTRGRFIIFVDGASYAIITPVNLFLLLKTSEDNEYTVGYGSVERVMRIVGLLIGALLPAFWLSLTTYHQNQLPFQLLATVVQSNTGLPFPTALEILLMLAMFELFREAGLRLPVVLGGTIGVVGGLIIGDAAIRAGITSPAMVVVIAISTIASFTLVNQNLATAISILRVFFILLSAFLGLFGFFLSFFFVLVYLSNIRTLGYPYMNITTDLSWSTIFKSLFRLPAYKYTKRPEALKTIDDTRTTQTQDQPKTKEENDE
ncbi:spore germination protein [Rummeliibacillus sp. G93]|uniref:spore germination protein n=1 Tax=Rummeliibacillus sp. G93 TaxID=2939494 RepID=UPI00201C4A6C|nr:spore germination protein [Rummeliibacillus sp. G93]UQW96191.1 spore germination protein [Rummeliibacillus sp. G93]